MARPPRPAVNWTAVLRTANHKPCITEKLSTGISIYRYARKLGIRPNSLHLYVKKLGIPYKPKQVKIDWNKKLLPFPGKTLLEKYQGLREARTMKKLAAMMGVTTDTLYRLEARLKLEERSKRDGPVTCNSRCINYLAELNKWKLTFEGQSFLKQQAIKHGTEQGKRL